MEYINFNLEYYRTFLFVGTFLSFTKAADALCISQPAVSQSIKKLEMELNLSLFTRSSDKLELTDEGSLLFSHVQAAFQEFENGEKQIRNYKKIKKDIKIGATETALRFYLPDRLNMLQAQQPNVSVRVYGGTTTEICNKLLNNEIESAYILEPLPRKLPFKLETIDVIQDIVVCGSKYSRIVPSNTYSLNDLSNEKWIGLDKRNSVAEYWHRWFFESGINFSPSYVVQGTGLMLPLVTNNLGIAILPECFANDEIQAGNIVRIKMQTLPNPRRIYLATNH